jgi:selenocysteine-specific elongation factor
VALLRAADPDARTAIAEMVFDRAVHVLVGDRFVLRDASIADGASRTIAGGTVLDIDVPARGRRNDARLRFLEVAARGDPHETLVDAMASAPKGIDLARWNASHNTAFTTADLDAHAVGPLDAPTLFSRPRWGALLAAVVDALAAEHAATPDALGPGRERLRRMSAPATDAQTFVALIDALKTAGRIAQTGAWLHLPDHRVELSAEDRARFDRARAILEAAPEPNNPPRVRDLALALNEDEAVLRETLARLSSTGELHRVAHDHYFLPATVRTLAGIAAELAEVDGVAKAAPFRDRIAVGRKVAIQILEFFDRIGYTRRIGDDHRIIQPALFDG